MWKNERMKTSGYLIFSKWMLLFISVVVASNSHAEVKLRDGSLLSESPVRIVSYVEVSTNHADEAEKLIRTYTREIQATAGNLETPGLRRIHNDNHFVILESWSTPDVYNQHSVAAKTILFRNKLQSMLIAPMDIRRHAVLTAAAAKEVAGQDQENIYVVTHMDVTPPQQFAPCSVAPDPDGPCANDLIKAFAVSSRKHSGNVRFEVLTQNNRSNHMTVVEAWGNVADHTAHLEHSQTVAFRSALAGKVPEIEFDEKTKPSEDLMIGSLWDERIYRKIQP